MKTSRFASRGRCVGMTMIGLVSAMALIVVAGCRPGSGGLSAVGLVGVDAGDTHTCAVTEQRSVRCWGDASEVAALPARMKSVSAGTGSDCALSEAGEVYCWNSGGREGDDASRRDGGRPVRVASLPLMVGLSASGPRPCGFDMDGAVWCWGRSAWQRPRAGEVPAEGTPSRLRGVNGAISIATSAVGHACAVTRTGDARCWGAGTDGQLGDGRQADSANPVPVSGLGRAEAIATGRFHTCALLHAGRVMCWGRGTEGQLGNGHRVDSNRPVLVVGVDHAIGVAAGGDQACAILVDRTVVCWGDNGFGVLGNGTPGEPGVATPSPRLVRGLHDVVSITIGENNHACALLAWGRAECWGNNFRGQLDDGSTDEADSPVSVVENPR